MTIHEKFKELRTSKGLTQAELADRVGIDRSMVAKIEGGKYINPTLGVLERIARELGASIDVLSSEETV
jgi:transcriptional regulator with XRE-family HTH domain